MNYNLEYGPNKITEEIKEIILDNKITTLIGENGSGKSVILEQLLKNYFKTEDNMIISYSSGLNESFSDILEGHVNEFNKGLNENGDGGILNSFYFTSKWADIIIYLAYFLEKGKTKNFIDNHIFLKGKELKFVYTIKNSTYKNYISKATEIDIEGENSLLSSTFHNKLKKFIGSSTYSDGTTISDIDYTKGLDLSNIQIDNNVINNVFDIPKEIENEEGEMVVLSKVEGKVIRNEELLSFLGIISSYLLNINNNKLFIGNNLLNDLSDGEFQLLILYALLDLFDGENTIFLFDEVDSHLHYKNINLLWKNLSSIIGKAITTTHIPDSIINNNIGQIKLVKDGIINSDNTANFILNRLGNISDGHILVKQMAGNIENIVLIDDCIDWFIFLELAKIKLGIGYNPKIEKIKPIKCPSDCGDGNEKTLAGDKCVWINNSSKINKEGITKNIFLIYDKDEYPINKIGDIKVSEFYRSQGEYKKDKTLDTTIKGTRNKTNIEYLIWKRREIENYFLSYTLLTKYGLLDYVNNELGTSNKLVHNNPGDNDKVRTIQAKEIIQKFAQKDLDGNFVWKDYNDLRDIIKNIPADEISEDIEKMHNFIVTKL